VKPGRDEAVDTCEIDTEGAAPEWPVGARQSIRKPDARERRAKVGGIRIGRSQPAQVGEKEAPVELRQVGKERELPDEWSGSARLFLLLSPTAARCGCEQSEGGE
jgi:hypothetical protein